MIRILVKIVFFIIIFESQKIEAVFKIGNYSHLNIPHLNTNECGFSEIPIIYELPLEGKCFKNTYKNKTVYGFDAIIHRQLIDSPHQRIFMGRNAKVGEAPFALYVKPKKFKWYSKWTGRKWDTIICTGVLITFEWVLTAAHCFEEWADLIKSGIEIFGGGIYKSGTQFREMNKYFPHPIYTDPSINLTQTLDEDQMETRRNIHDIALIKLKSKFERELTEDNKYLLNTICLPQKEGLNTTRDSDDFIYFGYGRVSNDENPYPNILQRGYIELYKYDECNNKSFCGHFVTKEPRICKGDSGGPLIQYTNNRKFRSLLIGITRSITTRYVKVTCDEDVLTGKFTAVPSHIDWILETIQNN